jgi:hypothetical protein
VRKPLDPIARKARARRGSVRAGARTPRPLPFRDTNDDGRDPEVPPVMSSARAAAQRMVTVLLTVNVISVPGLITTW